MFGVLPDALLRWALAHLDEAARRAHEQWSFVWERAFEASVDDRVERETLTEFARRQCRVWLRDSGGGRPGWEEGHG